VYTLADVQCRSAEFTSVLGADEWHHRPRAVCRSLYPVLARALRRVAWAIHIICVRLDVMDDQSAGETDTDA
jgi:hypothetical protein